jgi:hypothetical protein
MEEETSTLKIVKLFLASDQAQRAGVKDLDPMLRSVSTFKLSLGPDPAQRQHKAGSH